MRELSDGHLVAMAAAGDDSAFDELVSRYRTRVYYLALSKARGHDNALDIAQEAFVQAYVSLRTLREPEKFGAWLSSITANLCKMHLRRMGEVALPSEMIDELRVSTEPDADAALAREALDRLPNGTRSAAILYFIEEMKQAEIAEFLGISLAAVKSRVRDARTSLQKEMIHMVRQTAKKQEPGDEFESNLKHRLELARFYQEFSEMVDAGVTLVRSLWMLGEGNYSQPVRDAATEVRLAVESGSTLSDALLNAPTLRTPESVGLVRAGEYAGSLELTLRSLVRCIEARTLQRDIDLYTWCRTLGETLGAGVGIIQAFECAVDFAVNSELEQATRDMMQAIHDCRPEDRDARIATPLSQAASLHPDLFPPMVRLALHVGEYYGSLDAALKWLANDLALDMARRLGPVDLLKNQSVPGGGFLDTEITRGYLKHESSVMRAAAATLLARVAARDAGVEAAGLLADADSEVRKAAIRAVVDLQCRAAVDGLIACLSDEDAAVRRAALSAVSELRLHEAAQAIALLIPDPDMRTRHAAILALESMGEIDLMTGRAIELIVSENPDAVNAGVGILMDHPTPAAGDALTALLREDEDRFGAAVALGRIGRRESIASLRRLLSRRRWTWWTNIAAELLGQLGDAESAALMRKAVEDGEISERFLGIADELERR